LAERLQLKESPEVSIFRGVVKVIREDPTLKRIGLNVNAWEDSPDDLKEITADLCPHVEISPSAGETRWSEANQHKSDFNIDFLLTVNGTNADDVLNLWHAIREALLPTTDATLRAKVQAYLGPKANNFRYSKQPYQIVPRPGSVRMLQGEGAISIILNVNT